MFGQIQKLFFTARASYLRQKKLSGLDFGKKPNQYYLVSYPKSGNTWVRFLLGNLLCQEREALSRKNIWLYIPDSHDNKQDQYIKNTTSSFYNFPYQFVKSHDPYFFYYRNKKVIYIVRDGRDVLSSYFHYQNSRQKNAISLSELIQGKGTSSNIGLWSEHVVGWAKSECKAKIILKYEDLLRDPFAEIKKLLEFLDWKLDETIVEKAIINSSFKSLQEIEDKYGIKYQEKISDDIPTRFFRAGEIGNWKKTFSPEEEKLFWKNQMDGMNVFNYQ